MSYIILSIPIFFFLIGIELLISYLKKSNLYRVEDAITNISCGILMQLTEVFSKTVLIIGYTFLYNNYRLFTIPDTVLSYIFLFIGVDFLYYWFHRYAHEINILWGAHIVHHQSEDYNLSVALRQSSFQMFISMIFYLPLSLFGFNPIAFVAMNAFQTLYQFWIHTKTVDKLHPAIEYIFATPSNHRVHHGRNPQYIDKNHGGTLIIFDRMFGTYQLEEEKVIYGVVKPLACWNPFWANFDCYADIWRDLQRHMSFTDKVKLLYKKPGWLPAGQGGFRKPEAVSDNFKKYSTSVSPKLNYYIIFQYVVLLVAVSYILFTFNNFDQFEKILIAAVVTLSVVIFGGLMEGKQWAKPGEVFRLAAVTGLCFIVIWCRV